MNAYDRLAIVARQAAEDERAMVERIAAGDLPLSVMYTFNQSYSGQVLALVRRIIETLAPFADMLRAMENDQ